EPATSMLLPRATGRPTPRDSDPVARGNARPEAGVSALLPRAPRALLPGATARLAKDLPSAIIRPPASSAPLPSPAGSPQGAPYPAALPGATELLLPGATATPWPPGRWCVAGPSRLPRRLRPHDSGPSCVVA